jgi:hypothetical protein
LGDAVVVVVTGLDGVVVVEWFVGVVEPPVRDGAVVVTAGEASVPIVSEAGLERKLPTATRPTTAPMITMGVRRAFIRMKTPLGGFWWKVLPNWWLL